MPITKELLKQEIDHIQDHYVDALYIVSIHKCNAHVSFAPQMQRIWGPQARTLVRRYGTLWMDTI